MEPFATTTPPLYGHRVDKPSLMPLPGEQPFALEEHALVVSQNVVRFSGYGGVGDIKLQGLITNRHIAIERRSNESVEYWLVADAYAGVLLNGMELCKQTPRQAENRLAIRLRHGDVIEFADDVRWQFLQPILENSSAVLRLLSDLGKTLGKIRHQRIVLADQEVILGRKDAHVLLKGLNQSQFSLRRQGEAGWLLEAAESEAFVEPKTLRNHLAVGARLHITPAGNLPASDSARHPLERQQLLIRIQTADGNPLSSRCRLQV